MNLAVKKFLNYLHQYYEKLSNCIKEDYNKTVLSKINCNQFDMEKIRYNYAKKNNDNPNMLTACFIIEFLRMFEMPKEEFNKNRYIFTEFKKLSNLMKQSPLNNREKFEVIKYLLLSTFDKYPDDDLLIIMQKDIETIKFRGMSNIEYQEFIRSAAFTEILKKDAKDLTEEEHDYLEKIIELIKKQKIVNNKEIAMRLIRKHYFDKIDSFNDLDIKIIIRSFKILGIDEDICKTCKYLLEKEKDKRKEKEIPVINQENKPNKMSQTEYDRLFKEVESLYDIQNHNIVKPLELREIIYLVSLLYKIRVSEQEIIKCILTINKYGIEPYNNPLAKLAAYYDKIKNSNNDFIKKALENILNYSQELFIPESADSYAYWLDEINLELNFIMREINKDYQYELIKGKTL